MRKILFSLTIFCLFVSLRGFAAQENLSAGVKADKPRITIGDALNYTVTLGCPPDYRLLPPEKPAEIGLWEVKDLKIAQEKKDKLYSYLNYTLTTFTTGEVTIPEMEFQFIDVNGSTATVKTLSSAITVESVLGLVKGPAGIRDIKPPLSLKIPAGIYIFWFLVVAALCLGAWFWYQNYRKGLPQLPQGPVEPAVPPYQTAMEELEKLKNSGLVEEVKMKEFYIALSEIIRKYLAAVYSIDTMDKTTGEIYQELRKHEQDKKALINIREFFEECDLVKFAKFKPDAKTAWEDFERAEKTIDSV